MIERVLFNHKRILILQRTSSVSRCIRRWNDKVIGADFGNMMNALIIAIVGLALTLVDGHKVDGFGRFTNGKDHQRLIRQV